MATPKKKITNVSSNAKVGIGATLTAAAVAAAGAYFLYGSKNATKNRKAVKGWVEDAKTEVVKKLEKAKTMTKEEYDELIEKVGQAQTELKKVSKADLVAFKKEMKDGWKVIAKNAASVVASAGAVVPKASAKAKVAPKSKAVTVKTAPRAVTTAKKATTPKTKAPTKKKAS